MDKIDVLKIIRANDEKFKKHIEKIHQLEEREKKLNLNDLIKQNQELKKKQAELLNSHKQENDNNYPFNLPLQTFHSISSASEESPEKKKNIEEKKNYVMEQICATDENEENNNEKCDGEKSDDNVLEYSKDEEDNEIKEEINKNNSSENKIRTFLSKLNSKLNIDNPSPKEEQKKREKQKPPTKNLDKVVSHYYQSDSEENENCNNDQQLNENYLNHHLPEINSLSLGESDKPDLMTPNFNQSPVHSMRIKQLNPRKFSTVAKENINQAVLDNINKKKYTAYTYSTIQKKKNTEKPKKSKIILLNLIINYRAQCL